DGQHRALDQLVENLVLLAVLDRLELHLALDGGNDVGEVADPRHHLGFRNGNGASLGVGQQALVVGDGRSDGDAGALVNVRAAARETADLGDDLLHVLRHGNLEVVVL